MTGAGTFFARDTLESVKGDNHGKILSSETYIPAIHLDEAIEKLRQRQKDIDAYAKNMNMKASPLNSDFQKKYDGFYRVSRNKE